MTKLRGVGLALLLVAVACALVPILGLAGPSEVTVSGTPYTAPQPSPVSMHRPQEPATKAPTTKAPATGPTRKAPATKKPGQSDPGPLIDSETKRRADSEQTRTKLVVAGFAVVLLGLVVWGRRARGKRRKAD